MQKEIITTHHLKNIIANYADCKSEREIIERANKIAEALAVMVNPWDELIYPNIDIPSMANVEKRMAQAVRSGNYTEIKDYNGSRQNYDALCRACPNYISRFSKKCRVKIFEMYGF